uniref:Conotoxin Bt3.4 n=1 Tax=Conus betulinus TaxID=89764 RepID=F5BDG2_CONBE|nr:conotoxin Bt3.4 [Conus betulinus]
MMSKLGVLLTICLLLFPLTALPMDGDQPQERKEDEKSAALQPWFDPVKRCCQAGCSRYMCLPCCQ